MAPSPTITFADARKRFLAAPWLTAVILFLVTTAIYWATRTHYHTFDAVSYANQVGRLFPRTGDRHWLFHPHHLLFNATGYALWRASQAFGYQGGPLVTLQRMNAILGGLGVAFFYLTLRRVMLRSRTLPCLAALGMAASYGYWVIATDGRVNMPSLTLLLAALMPLAALFASAKRRTALALGILSGAAVLYHESAVLFAPVAFLGVLFAEIDPRLDTQAAKWMRLRLIAVFITAWLATVLIPYALTAWFGLGIRSFAAYRQWTAAYAELGWWWSFHIPQNLRLDLYALRHAAFAEPPGKQGTFHIARRVGADLRLFYFAALTGWFVAAYAFLSALPLLWRSHHRRLMIVCLIWIALYGAFFTVWNPGYFVFWVPVLAPVALLLAVALGHYRSSRYGVAINWLVGVWIALLAVVNWQASLGPHHQTGASPYENVALDIRRHTRPGDVILVGGTGHLADAEVFIPYFADRDVISIHGLLTHHREDKAAMMADAAGQMQTAIQTGHAVYALGDLWRGTDVWIGLQKRHPEWSPGDLPALTAPYDRTLAWETRRGPVWRLVPKPIRVYSR